MPCTQDAPLHFTESDDNQLNRKRPREAAYWLHDAVNREWCNPYTQTADTSRIRQALIFLTGFQVLLPENLCESGSFVKCLHFHLKNRLDNIHRRISSPSSGSRSFGIQTPCWTAARIPRFWTVPVSRTNGKITQTWSRSTPPER